MLQTYITIKPHLIILLVEIWRRWSLNNVRQKVHTIHCKCFNLPTKCSPLIISSCNTKSKLSESSYYTRSMVCINSFNAHTDVAYSLSKPGNAPTSYKFVTLGYLKHSHMYLVLKGRALLICTANYMSKMSHFGLT